MRTIVVLHNQVLGSGDDKLGAMLMGSFLRKLWASQEKPDAIIFYNTAIKLLAKGSPVLDALTGLSQAGVDLIACTTCMNYYDIKQDAIIGRVGDMNEVISLLLTSEKVITP